MKYLPTSAIGHPLSDDDVIGLGYEPTPNGWRPLRAPTVSPESEAVAMFDVRNPNEDRGSVAPQDGARNPEKDRGSVSPPKGRPQARTPRPQRPKRTR